MRTRTLLALTAGSLLGLASAAMAQDAPADTKPDAANAAAPEPYEVRAAIHRTMAALIEAQSAEKPDQANIKALNEKLLSLREQLRKTQVVASGQQGGQWTRPFGYGGRRGPGAGWGRGQCPFGNAGQGAPGARRGRGQCPFGNAGRGGPGMGRRAAAGRGGW